MSEKADTFIRKSQSSMVCCSMISYNSRPYQVLLTAAAMMTRPVLLTLKQRQKRVKLCHSSSGSRRRHPHVV